MLHSSVLDHSLHQMRSWSTLADHIVHVFQYELIVFVCCSLFVGFRSPLSLTLCLIVLSFVLPFLVELDLCLSVTPLLPSHSPPKFPQAPHQCKGVLPPANGKLLHRRALHSRYCEKRLSEWKTHLCLV